MEGVPVGLTVADSDGLTDSDGYIEGAFEGCRLDEGSPLGTDDGSTDNDGP